MDFEQKEQREKETETVTIKLSHYNELKIISDAISSREHILCNFWSRWIMYTKDELVERLAKELEEQTKEIDKLRHPHKYVKVDDVKSYSIIKFLKWRKNYPWYQRNN